MDFFIVDSGLGVKPGTLYIFPYYIFWFLWFYFHVENFIF